MNYKSAHYWTSSKLKMSPSNDTIKLLRNWKENYRLRDNIYKTHALYAEYLNNLQFNNK